MALVLDGITFDCHDIRRVADFWAAALDYEMTKVKDGWITLTPREGKYGAPLGFQSETTSKQAKNRLHLDVSAVESIDDEVKRLIALGATYEQKVVNGDGSWHVVLHDPEDNELCVVSA